MQGQQPGIDCDWCGTALKGKQRRWCSRRCSNWYTSEHRYSWARKVVLKHARRNLEFECSKCKRTTDRPEVNHIVPVLGKHAVSGCWHHISNLEVVCHECHLVITRAQKEAGLFARRG